MYGKRLIAMALAAGILGGASGAQALDILSAGAVEAGIRVVVSDFEAAHGGKVVISYATAPEIARRMNSGASPDVLIAPTAVIETFSKSGKLDGSATVPVGRIGLGLAVRDGTPVPDVSTTDAVKQALLAADGVVFNRASTGLYVEKLLVDLGVADALKSPITRYDDAAAVMQHLIKGRGREIGLGALTVIAEYRTKGLILAGPLPAAIQNFTSYAATKSNAPSDAASAFIAYLGGPNARRTLADRGIEARQ